MKKKKKAHKSKIHQYLYKNSYLYKWGTQIMRSKIGRIVVILIVAGLAIHLGYGFYKNHQVKSFLMQWQQYQNDQNYEAFIKLVDLSPENPYASTFPDWEGQFFNTDLKLIFMDISVSRIESELYEARVRVIFQRQENIENQFEGLIYVREKKNFKVIRVEI